MIKLNKAMEALKASEEKANELKVAVSTAVVDEHGVLIAFSKMDEAIVVSSQFALSKAHTSALLSTPSGDLAGYAAEGKPYFSINTAFGGQFLLVAGGIPVKGGGAIGVGGSLDVSQDVECAKAAAEVLEKD